MLWWCGLYANSECDVTMSRILLNCVCLKGNRKIFFSRFLLPIINWVLKRECVNYRDCAVLCLFWLFFFNFFFLIHILSLFTLKYLYTFYEFKLISIDIYENIKLDFYGVKNTTLCSNFLYVLKANEN